MNRKHMITATFCKENIKENANKASELLIGSKQVFYCGNDETEAKRIFNELPNEDKELLVADVEYTTVNGKEIIKSWQPITE